MGLRCSVRRVAASHIKAVSCAAGGPIELCRDAGYSFDEDSFEVRTQLEYSHTPEAHGSCY